MGTLQILAQIGSFVPAEKFTVGLASKIFTRIQSLETASTHGSSFTIDCGQVATMINQSDQKSLLLIDEFGKGTNEFDGAALLSAVIKHFAYEAKRFGGPRMVITTHLLEIFQSHIMDSMLSFERRVQQDSTSGIGGSTSQTIDFAVMKSIPTPNNSSIATPLYLLESGVSSDSGGLDCARTSGIQARVIERAESVLFSIRNAQQISRNPSVPDNLQDVLSPLMKFFTSVNNWSDATDEETEKLMQLARLSDLNIGE